MKLECKSGVVFFILLAVFSSILFAGEPIIIPYVTDPSPVLDGNLQEWGNRGVFHQINSAQQVTYTTNEWKGPRDLIGWVRFGYESSYIRRMA